MRIAMLVRRFDPAGGGTERDFAAAAHRLCQAGHNVTIYAARSRIAAWQSMAVRRLRVPPLPRSLEVLGFGLLADRFARREGAELTISFGRTVDSDLIRCEGGAHAAYLEAARQWESPPGSTLRALSPYHAAQCRIERRGFTSRRLKRVLAISGLVAADLERRFGIAHSRVEVLYNGVDHERFKSSADTALREEVRARLGIERSTPVVLFIGNGFARKGLGKLIEAMPMADRRIYLAVAGEDRAARSYQALARRIGVERRVLFLGRRDDIAQLMAAADVVALPSLFEAFGNTVLEGMAAGLPVLTSARCGAAEVLPAPLQPFVVRDPMNPGEIAGCLDGLLAAAPELGEIGRAAAAQFTWERFGRRLLEVIDALGNAKAAASNCAP